MTVFEGTLSSTDVRVAIVVARFNDLISEHLLAGSLGALQRHGIPDEAIDVARVPGSFELPVTARRLARSHRYDVVICLGAVIRGETAHFEMVAGQTAAGIAAVALETGTPVIFGVLTTDTLQQAFERAGGKAGNKGADAALAAIEMANLLRVLPVADEDRAG